MIGTAYWYMHTDQWRTDGYSADSLSWPLARGHLAGKHTADTIAQSARLGWMPFYPQFSTNPLQVAEEAQAAVDGGRAPSAAAYVANALHDGTLQAAIEDVDAPENWPRTLVLWRSNLMGSSAKGNEYFLKHLLVPTRTSWAPRTQTPQGRPTSPGATRHRKASSTSSCPRTSG
jgi:nitrate reductase alpha subunit